MKDDDPIFCQLGYLLLKILHEMLDVIPPHCVNDVIWQTESRYLTCNFQSKKL